MDTTITNANMNTKVVKKRTKKVVLETVTEVAAVAEVADVPAVPVVPVPDKSRRKSVNETKRKYTKKANVAGVVPSAATFESLTSLQQKLISPYLPFIPPSHHHHLFQISPAVENPSHIHALLFSVWTLAHSVQDNAVVIPEHFLSIPFHSFLFHIHNTY
jgi:hypothetical protein